MELLTTSLSATLLIAAAVMPAHWPSTICRNGRSSRFGAWRSRGCCCHSHLHRGSACSHGLRDFHCDASALPPAMRQSDRITSPLTYGVCRPVILLPKTMGLADAEQLTYVFTHEMTHIKRFDVLLKAFLTATACVHWFNPLVWVMLILANRDIELACDEKVLRETGFAAKSAYALALIGLEEQRGRLSPLSSSFSKTAAAERITAIMKAKRPSFLAFCMAAALVAGISATFATAAAAPQYDSIGIVTQPYRPYTPQDSDAGLTVVLRTSDYTVTINPFSKDGLLRAALNLNPDGLSQADAAQMLSDFDFLLQEMHKMPGSTSVPLQFWRASDGIEIVIGALPQ